MTVPNDVAIRDAEKDLFEKHPLGLLRSGYLKIKTKDAKRIPLKLNKIQQKILDAVNSQKLEKKPVRIAIVKFRQGGASTFIEAVIFSHICQKANRNALILSADDDGSNHLFNMSKLFHDELESEHPDLTPKLKYSNEKKLEYWHKRSMMIVDSAQNPRAGRSYTFQDVHLSEAAHFPHFKDTMLAISQAVPELQDTHMFIETTANGENEFYLWWTEIMRCFEAGDTTWIPLFLSWKDHEEYVRPFHTESEKTHFQNTMSNEERFIQTKFGLTLEQMNWRRRTIIDKCGGDKKKFQQEYPLSADEAFLTSSRRIFGPEHTDPQAKNLDDKPYKGELEWVNHRPAFVTTEDGALRVYDTPKKGHRYVMAIDACEGISGGDNAAIQIIDRSTWTQAAVYHANISPDLLARKAFNLGIWYNVALCAPEVNGPGLVTVLSLRDLGYPSIIHRTSLAVDAGEIKESDELGWNTNMRTKPLIISDLESSLREILLVVKDRATLDELRHYIKKDDGTLGGSTGWHDDLVMALAIAVHFAKTLPEGAVESVSHAQEVHSQRRTGY